MFLKLWSPGVRDPSSASSSDPACSSEQITPSKIPQLTRRRHSFSHPYPEHALANESTLNVSIDQTFDPFEDGMFRKSKSYAYEFYPAIMARKLLPKTVRFEAPILPKPEVLAQLSPERPEMMPESGVSSQPLEITSSSVYSEEVEQNEDNKPDSVFAPMAPHPKECYQELVKNLKEIVNTITGNLPKEESANSLASDLLHLCKCFQEAKTKLANDLKGLEHQLVKRNEEVKSLTHTNLELKEDILALQNDLKVAGKLYSFSVFEKVDGASKYMFENFDLYVNIKALVDKNKALLKENEDLKQRAEECERSALEMLRSFSDLKAESKRKDESLGEIKSLKTKVSFLQDQLSVRTSEFHNSCNTILELKSEKECIQSKNHMLQNQLEESKTHAKKLEKENRKYMSSISDMKEQLDIEQGVVSNLQNELNHGVASHIHHKLLAKKEIEAYQETICDLHDKMEISEKEKHEILDRIGQMGQVLQETDYELLRLTEFNDKERHELGTQLKELLESNKELEAKLEKLQDERKVANDRYETLLASNTLLAKLGKRIVKSSFEALSPVLSGNAVEEFTNTYYQFVSKEVYSEVDLELLRKVIEFLTCSLHHLIAQYQESQTRLELEILQKQTYFDTLLDKYTTVIMSLNAPRRKERKRISEKENNE